MGKWALAAVAAVPLLLLGYCNLPRTSCTAIWSDVEGRDLAAPVDVCRQEPDTRAVGALAFARIGEHVYRVDKWERRQPGGPVCMIGVACFPLYERPRKEREWRLVRLEGPVEEYSQRIWCDTPNYRFGFVQDLLGSTVSMGQSNPLAPLEVDQNHLTNYSTNIYVNLVVNDAPDFGMPAISNTISLQVMPVPEPASFALLAAGLGMLGLWRRQSLD